MENVNVILMFGFVIRTAERDVSVNDEKDEDDEDVSAANKIARCPRKSPRQHFHFVIAASPAPMLHPPHDKGRAHAPNEELELNKSNISFLDFIIGNV